MKKTVSCIFIIAVIAFALIFAACAGSSSANENRRFSGQRTDFINGMAWIRNGRYGIIDTRGNEIVPFIYDFALPFAGGYAVVKLGGYYGIIDTSGNAIVPIEHQFIPDARRAFPGGRANLWRVIQIER